MNKLTLIIDGNWLLRSRASAMLNKFDKSLPDEYISNSGKDFQDLMAKSINIVINRFKDIDNIVIVADGGSWRKQITQPSIIKNITYKGNRTTEDNINWNAIYDNFKQFTDNCVKLGITCSWQYNIEGDDWIWYWSRYLNSTGTHCMIWSSDNDLKQLVQIDKNTRAFTCWYNDKNGLWLPDILDNTEVDDIDFFMTPQYSSSVLENVKSKIYKNIHYIDPQTIILDKIICGDSGDNIQPVLSVIKNGRKFSITSKMFNEIKENLNIRNVDDVKNNIQNLSKSIIGIKKLSNSQTTEQNLIDMINYNTIMVWLDESTIPQSIQQNMIQQEYNNFNVEIIRSNYKLLSQNKDSINYMEQIFDNI